MGLFKHNRLVDKLYYRNRPILSVYAIFPVFDSTSGTDTRKIFLVWSSDETVQSCFYNGSWMDEYMWTDDYPWTE